MKWNRHRRRAVFKSTVAIIGLVLFTVQLSYKFYVFSSQPLFGQSATIPRHIMRVEGRNAARHTMQAGDRTTPRHPVRFERTTAVVSGHVFLSLDKRYDLKHVFALLALHFESRQFPVTRPVHYPDKPAAIKENILLPDGERGPPAV